ncbi:MAG: hypothetical protein WC807_14775 [Hyphomicrobium sp.]
MSEISNLPEGAGETGPLKPKENFEPRPHLEDTRRDLIALRVKHGADSDIGHGCSNIIELIQQPELPSKLIQYQTERLARLLAVTKGERA